MKDQHHGLDPETFNNVQAVVTSTDLFQVAYDRRYPESADKGLRLNAQFCDHQPVDGVLVGMADLSSDTYLQSFTDATEPVQQICPEILADATDEQLECLWSGLRDVVRESNRHIVPYLPVELLEIYPGTHESRELGFDEGR